MFTDQNRSVVLKGFTVDERTIRPSTDFIFGEGIMEILDHIRVASLEESSLPLYPVVDIETALHTEAEKKGSVRGTVITLNQTPIPLDITICGVNSPCKKENVSVLCEIGESDKVMDLTWSTLCAGLSVPPTTPMDEILQLLPTEGKALTRGKRMCEG